MPLSPKSKLLKLLQDKVALLSNPDNKILYDEFIIRLKDVDIIINPIDNKSFDVEIYNGLILEDERSISELLREN